MRRQRAARNASSPPVPPPPQVEGLESAADASQLPLAWLWPGLIPAGALTLLQGKKGVGKSTLVTAIAAAVSGGPSPPGLVWSVPSAVIWHGEEAQWESVVVPRLAHAGAQLGRVHRIGKIRPSGQKRRLVLPDDYDELRVLLLRADAALLILDPLSSLCASSVDLGHPQQGRDWMTLLNDLAFEGNVSILATQHCKKGNTGDPLDAGYGSAELVNVARSVLRADRHPHLVGQHVLARVAGNARQVSASQLYKLVAATEDLPKIDWGGHTAIDAEAIAEGRGSEAERDEWADADQVLIAVIGSSWISAKDVHREAESAGISARMLRRAKARLGIPSRHRVIGTQQYWEWGPPRSGWPSGMVIAPADAGGQEDGGALGQRAPSEPPKTTGKKARRPRRPRNTTRPPSDPSSAPLEDTTNGTSAD